MSTPPDQRAAASGSKKAAEPSKSAAPAEAKGPAGLNDGSVAADVAQAEIDRLIAFVTRISALSPRENDLEKRAAVQDRNRAAFEAMNDAIAEKALQKARGVIAELRDALETGRRAAHEPRQTTPGEAVAKATGPLESALRDLEALRDYESEVLIRRFERETLGAPAQDVDAEKPRDVRTSPDHPAPTTGGDLS